MEGPKYRPPQEEATPGKPAEPEQFLPKPQPETPRSFEKAPDGMMTAESKAPEELSDAAIAEEALELVNERRKDIEAQQPTSQDSAAPVADTLRGVVSKEPSPGNISQKTPIPASLPQPAPQPGWMYKRAILAGFFGAVVILLGIGIYLLVRA